MDRFASTLDLLLVESGGDNLAAHFSRELVDYSIYVIDVSGGDKIPRKGGPGTTQSDLLVINKTDLAEMVGADLGVMQRDAEKMRGAGPIVFACIRDREGLDAIIDEMLAARGRALEARASSCNRVPGGCAERSRRSRIPRTAASLGHIDGAMSRRGEG